VIGYGSAARCSPTWNIAIVVAAGTTVALGATLAGNARRRERPFSSD
jgi:hypothetical protein